MENADKKSAAAKVWCASWEVRGRTKRFYSKSGKENLSLADMSIFLDLFDNDPFNDPFNDHFLRNPFGISSIFEFIDKQYHVVQEITHVVEDHVVQEITHVVEDHAVEEITQSKTCPIVRSFIGSAFKMTVTMEDTTMDVLRRPLMFKYDCILVTPLLVPHGKWGELELDYLVRNLALRLNSEKVADVKYIRKEQRNFIRKPKKVKMKLHQQRKRNKHGPFNKKAKMKCVVVSLADT